jgi:hypothetical protein
MQHFDEWSDSIEELCMNNNSGNGPMKKNGKFQLLSGTIWDDKRKLLINFLLDILTSGKADFRCHPSADRPAAFFRIARRT